LNIVAKSQINVLVQLAHLDKNFADVERDLIFRVGHGHNLTDDEIGTLIQNPQPVGTLGALSPRQKLNYLLDCIELIYADNKVYESELLFCRSLAIKMGLRKSVIDFLIENREIVSREKLQEKVFSEFIA
jgi:hypothetical protein